MTDSNRISRRQFLEGGVASIVGLGVAGVASDALGQNGDEQTVEPRIQAYRALGKTGWKVSDIAFGNAGMTDPTLLEYAIEHGINYVDTARQYYDMEIVIGKIFPQKRDKIFLTTKLQPELVTADVSEADVTAGIEESLQRLNTDYVDCCLIHSVGDPNLGDRTRIENENVHNAFAKAKRDGKIRFWGASAHGPEMIRDFTWLLENTDIDVIMPGMNYMTRGVEPVLAAAAKRNVAVVAMKSLSAARKVDFSAFKKEGRTIRQALLKWTLAQPNIDTISVTMRTFEDVDEFILASGATEPSPGESRKLGEYGALLNGRYCRPGCGACLGACPYDLPIHDILRYHLYFSSYGNEKYAMGRYATLPVARQAGRCTDCGAPCAGACPFDIAIRDRLIDAHGELMI